MQTFTSAGKELTTNASRHSVLAVRRSDVCLSFFRTISAQAIIGKVSEVAKEKVCRETPFESTKFVMHRYVQKHRSRYRIFSSGMQRHSRTSAFPERTHGGMSECTHPERERLSWCTHPALELPFLEAIATESFNVSSTTSVASFISCAPPLELWRMCAPEQRSLR
jgi:hypothetical protein